MNPVKACLSLSSCFVKQGKRLCSSKKKPHLGILHESSDWKLSVDFDASLVFPSFIAIITGSRPYIVIYSVLKKIVILIELTSPCEENFEELWVLRCYQSSAIRFVDTLPHYLIRVYSWKCGADGCYRQMWQVSCRRHGMLTQGPAPDPKSKV